MIYPANFEQKVGFDRLREQVAALCTIRGGRERLCAEQFSTSQADVERRLALADEMRRLLEMEHDFPDDEFVDVDYILSKLKIEGSFLEVEEVVLLRRALASAGAIAGFILGRGEELYPEPVSYTHLDVYKRQVSWLWATTNIDNIQLRNKKESKIHRIFIFRCGLCVKASEI